ncbi:semaphorin-4A isoform X3 [Sorex araneus]|uniref:semaphorin-4A isoform X3 n=1 Tax=Sorex araneus TaxID=42254 RepID=UPI00243405F3|nr:semaphorin-4A isoform X3 [Sorex araneus]
MALPALGLDPCSLLGLFLFQLLLQLLPPTTAGDGAQGPVPRVKFHAGDGRRGLSLFHQKDLQDFDTLLLSSDGGTLYVGAREAVLALDIQDPGVPRLKSMIPWPASDRKKSECAFKKKSNETQCFNFLRVLVSFNTTHLYACGTFAFSPSCTFIELQDSNLLPISENRVMEGKGQSPFDPAHKHTAVLADGMLYSGTMNNFLGSEPVLMRALGPQPVLKTDNFLRWLQPDASFVAAVPWTDVVYFFFEETASEFEFFERLRTSRVAQVCKNDVGGEKLLQKKWTTFLKAQLLCAQPGQLPFNVIRHAVLLSADASAEAQVFAVFTSQWQVGGTRSSAVCAFALSDIQSVFEGKYKELNKETSRWTTYGFPDISPRPGSCSAGPFSDKALTFMKNHFLMDQKVVGRPLLFKAGVEYTQLAVEKALGTEGHSHLVLYLGTATGSLHKAVVSGDGGAHLVEEIQLFPEPEPVRNLQLAPSQASPEASGGFPGPTVLSTRAVWTASLPGTRTVPGTHRPAPAASCPAPSRLPGSRIWSMGTLTGHAPVVLGAGAGPLRDSPKSLKKFWPPPTPSWSSPVPMSRLWPHTAGLTGPARSLRPRPPSTMAPSCCCCGPGWEASTSAGPLRMTSPTPWCPTGWTARTSLWLWTPSWPGFPGSVWRPR